MWDDVKDSAKVFEGLSSKEKAELPYIQLDPADIGDEPLPEEMIVNLIADQVSELPFLHENKGYYKLGNLQPHARSLLEPFTLQLLGHAGLEFLNNVMLELKFKPKDEPDSSDEEKRQADECKKFGDDKELSAEEYLKKLFVTKALQTKKVIAR